MPKTPDPQKMPTGGYDVTDVIPPKNPPKGKGKEFVDGSGGDYGMHALILGDDDQFITMIPVKKA